VNEIVADPHDGCGTNFSILPRPNTQFARRQISSARPLVIFGGAGYRPDLVKNSLDRAEPSMRSRTVSRPWSRLAD